MTDSGIHVAAGIHTALSGISGGLCFQAASFPAPKSCAEFQRVSIFFVLTCGHGVVVGAIRYAESKDGKKTEKHHEIDFVVNMGMNRVYIQSALSLSDDEKRQQEITPLRKSGDFFRKIVVTGGNSKPHLDEQGIQYTGVIPFLLDKDSMK